MSLEPEAEINSEPSTPDGAGTGPTLSQRINAFPKKSLLFIIPGLLLLLLLCLVCLLTILLIWQLRDGERPSAATAQPTLTPLAGAATSQPLVVGVSTAGTISVTLGTPVLLRLGGQEFNVRTDVVSADGLWTPAATGEGEASWIRDTVVNYIVGLPDLEGNEALLSQLAPGDEIQIVTNGRTSFTFTFTERNLLPVNDRSVYAQQSPGITLILLQQGGNERLIVRGRSAATADFQNQPGNVVAMGDTAQLDNFQMTTNAAIYVSDRPEIPAGFAFFQVDYTIQNVGLTALDTINLEMTLVDQLGNRYVLNPAASQSGNYPILNGFLNANQSTNATAGYLVPLGLDSETVNWVVINRESNAQLFVTLPFTGGETAVQGASSALFRAEVSADLTSLNLGGQITNLGIQPLVISESNIRLSTPDGAVYLLFSTNPPLPWTVAPGQNVQFFVSYQRPPGGTALFRVLNQEFQITEQP